MVKVLEVVSLIKRLDDVAIMFHKNPDGDALGSAMALCLGLQQKGKNCKILNGFDEVPSRFGFFIDKNCFDADFCYKNVIAVDLASSELICDGLKKVKIDLVIDHHLNCSLKASFGFVVSEAAATCELIYDILIKLGVEINKKIAQSLYIGIATDTGCFKFANTNSRTHEIAARLFEYEIDFAAINFALFDKITRAQLSLRNLAFQNLRFLFDGRCVVVVVSRTMLQSCGCVDADFFIVTDMLKSIEGVKVAVAARQIPSGFKFSVRTGAGFSAARFCEQFGGGGHENAAGFELKGELDQIENEVLEKIGEFFV